MAKTKIPAPSKSKQPVIGNLGRMVVVPPLQTIPDTAGLVTEMSKIWQDKPERAELVRYLRGVLDTGRAEIQTLFENAPPNSPAGAVCVRQQSDLTDAVLRALFGVIHYQIYPSAHQSKGDRWAIAATGGYGRAELAPKSDIDLLFITAWKQSAAMEQQIEFILYVLWDLGFKIGQAVRSVDECVRQARADQTIRTAMLESRLIAGDTALYGDFRQRFDRDVMTGNAIGFVTAKTMETATRHHQMGDSRYLLEPNIKSGKGALRDLHTLFWIAKFVHRVNHVDDLVDMDVLTVDEATAFDRAQNFFWVLRCHLHYLTGRAEDRLTFDRQPEIGRRMGYTDHAGALGVERFMKHYFLTTREVGVLSRIFIAAIQKDLAATPIKKLRQSLLKRDIDGFPVLDGFLTVPAPDHFQHHPIDMIRLFRVAQQHKADIHPRTLQAMIRHLKYLKKPIRENADANALFLDILTDSHHHEPIMRLMNDTGLLGKFIPDWGRVVSQMQYDMYHVYTVDEHTLRAVGFLHRMASGEFARDLPVATDVMRTLSSRRALFVAMLLHDIAKGRHGDHSILGEQVALSLCPRLGLNAVETDLVAWLVREHLLMSRVALKRDLDDPKVAVDFAEKIQSLERLRLLLVLTVADINAVGPGRWNPWKAGLLRRLYYQTEQVMSLHPNPHDHQRGQQGGRISQNAYDALRQALADWSDAEVEAYARQTPPSFWLAFEAENHARLARLMRDADHRQQPVALLTTQDLNRAVTEIAIYTHDRAGLFSCLAGALAAAGANILDARIFTMDSGRVLDVFTVIDAASGHAFDSREKLAKFSVLLQRGLDHPEALHEAIAARRQTQAHRTDIFTVPPRVLVDNLASNHHTVIEVNGRDRPGFLYDVTHALTALNLQISSAKIATYGEKIVDVFYIKDQAGLKITHDSRLQDIKINLMNVLQAQPGHDIDSPGRSAARDRRISRETNPS